MADIRMRSFNDIPPVIKNLMIINALVWLAELTFGESFINAFSLHLYYDSKGFGIWQLVTHMFLHSPNQFGHILMNMIVLWFFGSTLEYSWGSKRFLLFYLLCGIGAAIVQMGATAIEMKILLNNFANGNISQDEFVAHGRVVYNGIAMGASGAIMGVMAAFGYLFPNTPLVLFPLPIPVKIKYLVIAYILIDLFSGINPRYGDNVGHFAHVGGAVIGLILVITMNKTNRRTFY